MISGYGKLAIAGAMSTISFCSFICTKKIIYFCSLSRLLFFFPNIYVKEKNEGKITILNDLILKIIVRRYQNSLLQYNTNIVSFLNYIILYEKWNILLMHANTKKIRIIYMSNHVEHGS